MLYNYLKLPTSYLCMSASVVSTTCVPRPSDVSSNIKSGSVLFRSTSLVANVSGETATRSAS
jgi:hypothetical protein